MSRDLRSDEPGRDGPPAVGPTRARRRRTVLALVALGSSAMVGAMIGLLVTGTIGPDRSGRSGATSPAELGEQIIDAVRTRGDDDLMAALVPLLEPAEREVLGPSALLGGTTGGAVGEVMGRAVDGAAVGAAVGITGLDELAEVIDLLGPALSGTSVRIDTARLHGTVQLLLTADDGLGSPATAVVTAVEHEGRWYVGLGHTLVEALLGRLEPEPEVPAVGLDPRGGRTPEEAIDRLLGAVEGLDVARLLSLIHPGGAAAVQRIAPLVLDETQAALDRLPLRWRITERSITVSGSGDVRDVVVDRLVVSGRAGSVPFDLDLAADPARGPRTVTLRRHGDEWFLDPGPSLLAAVLAVMPAEDGSPLAVDELVDRFSSLLVQRLIEQIPELVVLLAPMDDGDGPATADEDATTGAAGDGVVSGDDGLDPVDRCYELVAVAEAIVCFADGIERGEIDPVDVPVELRFPECGAAEAAWAGYASLTDEAFITLVDEVRPCLIELVADGRLASEELPLAFADPACFEGRNWFAVLDDPEYTDRVLDCAGR